MNDIEREVIILNTVWEMIDDMVNWAMFVKSEKTEISNLMFNDSYCARLFAILLGDFLSDIRAFKGVPPPLGLKAVPSGVRSSDQPCCFIYETSPASPKLNAEATQLISATETFGDWLEGEFISNGVNLYNIGVVADIRIARLRYLKMCGDVAKHNLTRLAANVGHLRVLLEQAGHPVSEQEHSIGHEEFRRLVLGRYIVYHASPIAEFLNNIRWAIYDYLQPEFRRSWHLTDHATKDCAAYSYRVPCETAEPVAVAIYWDVMNKSRSHPFVQRFTIPALFKQRY